MTYEECVKTVGNTLKERGHKEHKELATGMCDLWASENGIERKFGRAHLSTLSDEPKRRNFGVPIETSEDMTFISDEKGVDTVQFPIIAITSGPHEYLEDDIEQKVYIEPTILKENIESFKELPIYLNHQRTPEDLIGMATEPEAIEMENGKTAIKMLATLSGKTENGNEVLEKVKEGDITHVSIDWLSNDVDVMGDTFATNVKPTEVSFIDNEKLEPVCKECIIGEKCNTHTTEEHHDCGCGGKDEVCECKQNGTTKEVETMADEVKKTDVKTDAENIVEREFASLRSQLETLQTSKKEIESQYEVALKEIEEFKAAEEERAQKEAEARKAATVDAIISKEILFGSVQEESKDTRVDELSAWDEMKLTGFSEALAAMPEPVEQERTFGKGKSNEGEAMPETEREFAVKMENGRIKLNPAVLRGD